MNRQHYVIMFFIILTSGCDNKEAPPPPLGYEITTSYNPLRCSCTDSTYSTIKNTDPLRDLIFTKDYALYKDGKFIDFIVGIPKITVKPGKEEEIGCKYYEEQKNKNLKLISTKEGSRTENIKAPTCRYRYEYKTNIKFSASLALYKNEKNLLGKSFTPTIESCLKVCSLPSSPFCYDLGSNAAIINKILQPIYIGVFSADSGIIKNEDIFKSLDLDSSYNNCMRSDTNYGNGVAQNNSKNGQACTVDLTKIAINKNTPLNAKLYATNVKGVRSSDKSLLNSSAKAISFPDEPNRITLRFTGNSSEYNNKHYAGDVFDTIYKDNSIILVTTNSCLLVRK
ncbi:hypothetical protein Q8725_12860 [Klebsiella michiganensis]|uniref:hypothetical protein n=1 Tax=Klebsiella michiganensis TaxID=1134687 RepID=UPI002738F6B5|nr:hypothetical protein [Klebsiella michiganensis]WLP19071.1 hypothetical protein Q8725_12860 [Klebsiella michiganensis]